MKNSKILLKKAMKKTTQFILNIEVNSSERIPEWYDQMALSVSHDGLSDSLYAKLLNKLSLYVYKEYGSTAAKFLLN